MLTGKLRLYDTKSREVTQVRETDGLVTMYCCGPTVYRDAHIGNMRTFLLSDLIRRTLKMLGYRISIIQNITDVGHMSEDFENEDKLLAQSKTEGVEPLLVAKKYEERFHADLRAFNILPADMYPKASECIGLMQDLIAQLISKKNRGRHRCRMQRPADLRRHRAASRRCQGFVPARQESDPGSDQRHPDGQHGAGRDREPLRFGESCGLRLQADQPEQARARNLPRHQSALGV